MFTREIPELKKVVFPKKVEGKPRNFKKERLTIFFVWLTTVSAILAIIAWRDGRKWILKLVQKMLAPQVIVSNQIGQTTPKPTPTPKFEKEVEEIKNLTKNLKGAYGVFVQDLASRESYGINQNQVFGAASLVKLPVLVALFKEVEAGNLDLETKYTLKTEDKRSGAGSLYYKPAGTVYTYREMAELMGNQSDNTAFNVFKKILGGEKIQGVVNSLGMSQTNIVEFEPSHKDIGRLFYRLYKENILIRDHRDELLSFLTETAWEDRIPAGIPKEIKVSHKVGTEIGIISDAGIVFAEKPFILVILSQGVLEKEAAEILPKIAETVYQQTRD